MSIMGNSLSTLLSSSSTPDTKARPGTAKPLAVADSERLEALSRVDAAEILAALGTSEQGFTAEAAEAALEKHGPNVLRLEEQKTILSELVGRAKNPLNALLFTLAIVSAFIGDQRAAVVIILMIILSVTLGFIQEHRSNQAAAKLRAMVRTTATVRRDGSDAKSPSSKSYRETSSFCPRGTRSPPTSGC